MAQPSTSLPATGNSFIDSLDVASRAALLPLLTQVWVTKDAVVAEPSELISRVMFPIRSVISTLTRMRDGDAVEVALAGHEGFAPLSAGFGSRSSAHGVIVQIPDSAYATSADVFLDRVKNDAHLRARVLAYIEYAFVAATQFAACNRLRAIEERYARWLLMASDRVGSGEFALTQEFTAQMLGVRRAGVTMVAGAFSASELITYRRGHVSVIDRAGLEDAACECYSVVNGELQRLMGYGARPTGPDAPVSGVGMTDRVLERKANGRDRGGNSAGLLG